MKFVILLLAFFIPLLASTGALKCYECKPLPGIPGFGDILTGRNNKLQWSEAQNGTKKIDCSMSKGVEKTCANDTTPKEILKHTYCVKITPPNNKVSARNCMFLYIPKEVKRRPAWKLPGCNSGGPDQDDFDYSYNSRSNSKLSICSCKGDFCNGHTKMVGMSVTTLLGGVLVLSLMKYL